MAKPDNMSVILDSGAFSAWRKHQTIDIDKYIQFVKDNEAYVDHVVNLDVIPGEFGRAPTREEVEESANQGWNNLKYMESKGLKPIPVFHQGEETHWLVKMLAGGYDYIGISPDNGKGTPGKRAWLDYVFGEFLTDALGKPIIKTHGFGVTAIELMFRYPWASCDSMTWLLISSYGGVFVPQWNNGFDYTRPPLSVKISKESPTKEEGTHFDNFGVSIKRHILEFFEQEGFTYEELNESFVPRTIVNVRVLQRIAEAMTDKPFEHKQVKFFE